ncbi:heavy-metal-associated domain-containing protein [Mordavella massiliensis]|uniref:Heavy-metal-associated domain-containing protein n=1 Tax=Mordavella massiliensis TaxID=1871024 RepID=A0A938X9D5_9CLOT|nr:heavy metal-associated domain-containing protein [Mordavella massiliensis]MBM6947639.1 heavy-metal-associated domain-containing protein [Mordavella massiliensis]
MSDVIIMIVILIVLIFAVKGSWKHFKGEGACCGGGSGSVKPKKPKKKTLDGPVIGRRTIRISGMHCQNCVNSVTSALNAIDGVSAKVNLKDNSAEVSYDRPVDVADLKRAVERAGFKVDGILQE